MPERKKMDINFKELSYGNLISHTFPGLVLLLEIVLAFKLFTPIDGFKILLEIDFKVINIIALLIVLYIFSTIVGIILDGIHHFIFKKKEGWDGYEIYKVISSIEQLQIYKKLVDEEYWYYYECYANIGISMIPGAFLIPYFLYSININIWFIIVTWIIYVLTLVICINEAINALNICLKIEKALFENFSKKESAINTGKQNETVAK